VTRSTALATLATTPLFLPLSPIAAQSAFLRPTPSEVFHLRSECVALGDKILDGPAPDIRTFVAQSQISHYNPQTNRCYVAIIIHFVDGVSRFLYDGQTRELLASTHFIVQNAKSEM